MSPVGVILWRRLVMRRFSIRVRMVGAIGAVLGLLLMVGGAGLWGVPRPQTLSHQFATATRSFA